MCRTRYGLVTMATEDLKVVTEENGEMTVPGFSVKVCDYIPNNIIFQTF